MSSLNSCHTLDTPLSAVTFKSCIERTNSSHQHAMAKTTQSSEQVFDL